MNERQQDSPEQGDDNKAVPNVRFWEAVTEVKVSSLSALATAVGRCNTAKAGLLGSLATLGWIASQVVRNSAELTGTGLIGVLAVTLLVGGVGFASLYLGSKRDGPTKTTDARAAPEP
jgi:hypothetical protein